MESAYRVGGTSGLKAKQASGRPHKLLPIKKKLVEQMLLSGAKKAGFPTDLWTCPRVAKAIYKLFHIHYHPDHIGRLLHSMGWSPQEPERRARERNEHAIAGWVKVDWERIKKKPIN